MNFTISQLDRNTDGGVTQVHWSVSKTSGSNTASAYGSCTFIPDTTADGYVAYAALTEANAIAWVKESIDVAGLEGTLDADLSEQSSPTTLSGVPW